MNRWISSLFALVAATMVVVALSLPTPAQAASCSGVSFPDTIEVDGDELKINGMGIREATIFQVNVYVAALYVPDTSSSGAKLVDPSVKKKLVLSFVRDVDRLSAMSTGATSPAPTERVSKKPQARSSKLSSPNSRN